MENLEQKEKALEIYNKMKGFRISNRHRMKCALVVVDEMIDNMIRMADMTSDEFTKGWLFTEASLWKDVRVELEIIKSGFPPIKRKKNGNS